MVKKFARERAVQVLSEEIVEYLESQDIMFIEKEAWGALQSRYYPQNTPQTKADSDRMTLEEHKLEH